jgi:2-polyprenyl-6-methoxyphenol hydroxylase-like FAD-dependent oxidoreductase
MGKRTNQGVNMTLQDVIELAKQLSPTDKKRLVEQLLSNLESESEREKKPRQSLLGICKDLGQAPSDADIDEMRKEVWKNFPREDI